MKKHPVLSTLILGTLISLSACRTHKAASQHNAGDTGGTSTTDICSKAIKYHSDGLKIKGGTVEASVDVTVDPENKKISFVADSKKDGHEAFDAVIDKIDCNLSKDLKSGQAFYYCSITQPDGHVTQQIMKIAYTDDGLSIMEGDPSKTIDMVIVVSTWQQIR
jgi:hypothetical protein